MSPLLRDQMRARLLARPPGTPGRAVLLHLVRTDPAPLLARLSPASADRRRARPAAPARITPAARAALEAQLERAIIVREEAEDEVFHARSGRGLTLDGAEDRLQSARMREAQLLLALDQAAADGREGP